VLLTSTGQISVGKNEGRDDARPFTSASNIYAAVSMQLMIMYMSRTPTKGNNNNNNNNNYSNYSNNNNNNNAKTNCDNATRVGEAPFQTTSTLHCCMLHRCTGSASA